MCCHQSDSSYLGNLFERPFEDLWFSKFAEDIRDAIREKRLHSVCNTIQCPFKYKNIEQEVKQITADARGYPREIEFDLHGSHCNFGGLNPTPHTACIMCPRARPDFAEYLEKTPDRTDELIETIRHLTPNLNMINILGIAEPFWKDKIFDVLDKMDFSKHKSHIKLWTTSNGSIFNEKRQERLCEIAEKTDIHFSLDAASSETFMKIRQNNFFDVICKNIKMWTKRRETGTGKHYVRLHNNINSINVHEVPDMVRLAKDLGVDVLILLPTHDCGGTHISIKNIIVSPTNFKRFVKAQTEAEKVAKEIGQEVIFSRPLGLDYDKQELVQLRML